MEEIQYKSITETGRERLPATERLQTNRFTRHDRKGPIVLHITQKGWAYFRGYFWYCYNGETVLEGIEVYKFPPSTVTTRPFLKSRGPISNPLLL